MIGIPAFGTRAPGRLLGALRSWLQGRPDEFRASEEAAARRGTPRAPLGGPARVMVVDDVAENLLVMAARLRVRGLVPVLAADGAEAVSLACERRFDLILMDLQMPVLDGLSATTEIRRFEADTSRTAVPVIAYSSCAPGAAVLAAYGLNGSLAKPCEDQELEDCLARWCPSSHGSASALRAAALGNSFWKPESRATNSASPW